MKVLTIKKGRMFKNIPNGISPEGELRFLDRPLLADLDIDVNDLKEYLEELSITKYEEFDDVDFFIYCACKKGIIDLPGVKLKVKVN